MLNIIFIFYFKNCWSKYCAKVDKSEKCQKFQVTFNIAFSANKLSIKYIKLPQRYKESTMCSILMIMSLARGEPDDNSRWCTARVVLWRKVAAYIQTIITVLILKTIDVMWHGKKHIELFISDENLFYAWRDKKMIRAYVNTPATAKLDLAVTYRQSHLVGFFVGSQKKLKINWIR